EQEGDAVGGALVAQVAGPVRVHGAGALAALAADDDPVDTGRVAAQLKRLAVLIRLLLCGGGTQDVARIAETVIDHGQVNGANQRFRRDPAYGGRGVQEGGNPFVGAG